MAEEYNIVTPSGIAEGGSEIPADTLAAIETVAANIDSIIAIANSMDDSGNVSLPFIDGNLSNIRMRRDTEANFLALNPILNSGEFAITIDKSDPYEVKLGDDVTPWEDLENILLISEVTSGDLGDAIAAAEAAQAAAELAKTHAEAAEVNAETAETNAAASALLASQWASAPETVDLPGGKKSAEVYASRGQQTALTSRFIPLYSTVFTSGFTFSNDLLFKRSIVNLASNADVTIPAGIFSSANYEEAWALIRKVNTGNLRAVAAAAGSDLQRPTIVKTGFAGLRVETASAVNSSVDVTLTGIPAVVDGKIVVVIEGHPSDTAVKTATCTASIGGSFTQRTPPVLDQNREAQYSVFDADLDAYAGGNATVTGTFGTMTDYMGVYVFIVEGHGGAMSAVVKDVSTNTGSSKTLTLPSVPASSLVLGFGGMRGAVGTVGVASFGAGQTNLGTGDYSVWPSSSVGSTAAFKNGCWGASSGAPNTTADFNWTINFNSSAQRPAAVAFSYPPKSVAGAGTVDLRLMGGRDTLNVLNGDMELWFAPDGKTVYVKTPSA